MFVDFALRYNCPAVKIQNHKPVQARLRRAGRARHFLYILFFLNNIFL